MSRILPLAVRLSILSLVSPAFGVGCSSSSSAKNTADASADVGTDAVVVTDTGPSGDSAADAAPETISTPDAAPEADAAEETAPVDACVAPTTDQGAVDTTNYPAFATELSTIAPHLYDEGGPILTSPVITPITWPGTASGTDANASIVEAFVDKLPGSTYWTDVTAEYGIGAATVTAHVELVPATTAVPLNDDDARNLIIDNVGVAGSTWPAPAPGSIYVIFLPTGIEYMLQGQNACEQGIGGYHQNTLLADNVTSVAFAVVLRCASGGGLSAVDFAEAASTHEIAEAATDPQPPALGESNPAYYGFRDQDYAWSLFQQENNEFVTEVGDDCELYSDSFVSDTELGGYVQRLWSGNSVAAGGPPCVPKLTMPYFSAVPLAEGLQQVDVKTNGHVAMAYGYNIPVNGCPFTFQAGFYSDAAMGAWGLKAVEGNALPGTGPTGGNSTVMADGDLTITQDKTTGQNGEKANITVSVKAIDGTFVSNLLTLVSYTPTTIDPTNPATWTADTQIHYFPVLITSN